MIVHNDIKQGTKEWQDIRKLKFTASHASTILARGRGVQTLIKQMLADYYSSGNYEEYSDKYKNSIYIDFPEKFKGAVYVTSRYGSKK